MPIDNRRAEEYTQGGTPLAPLVCRATQLPPNGLETPMIRSDPWSRYQVQRDRRPVRRRMLLVIPLVVLLLYVAVHFVGVDWTQAQAIPLVDLGGQRWE